MRCQPSSACIGGRNATVSADDAHLCSPGYTGQLCAACSAGSHRAGDECVPCPDDDWTAVAAFVGAVLLLAGVVAVLSSSRKRINPTGVAIGLVMQRMRPVCGVLTVGSYCLP